MKTIRKRLRSCRGETLIESMVAILIFTFASILFLSLVTAAADVNITVQEADETFQSQQLAIEENTAATTAASVSLKNGETELLQAEIYSNNFVVTKVEDDALYAYFLKEGGEGT